MRPARTALPTVAIEVAGVDPQRELLGLASTLLDLLWLHPLLVLSAGPGPDGAPRLALWPLVALAVAARSWVAAWERRGGVRGPVLVLTAVVVVVSLAGLIALTLGLPYLSAGLGDWDGFSSALRGALLLPALATGAAGGFLWWRTVSGHAYGVVELYNRFGLIIVSYFVYFAIGWLTNSTYATVVLVRDMFGVFLVGLSALTLARSRMEAGQSRSQLGTGWLLSLLAGTGVILAIGLLFGSLLGGDIAAALLTPLLGVLQAVGFVLFVIAQVLAFLAAGLFELLLGWMGRVPPPPPTPTPTPVAGQGNPWEELRGQAAQSPAGNPILLAVIGTLVVALVLFWLVRKVLQSADRRRRLLGGGERESLFNWRAALDSLANLMPTRPVPEPDSLLALAANPAYRHTVRVRRAYRRTLAQAAALGTARRPAQTARDVLPALQSALPTARAPLAQLTDLYTATRYTTTPATPAEADAAEAAANAVGSR